MEIQVKYNGEYPNLCSGKLIIIVGGKKWVFPKYCLLSGGTVSFDDDWNEEITEGPWIIHEYPKGFPENLEQVAEDAVNESIPYGCCGGCV